VFQSNDCQRGFCLCQDRCLNLTRFFSNNLNRHSLPLHVFCFYSCRWWRDRYVEWIVARGKNESIGYFAWPSIKTVHSNRDAIPVRNAKHKSTLDILQLHRCVTKLQLCSFQMKLFYFFVRLCKTASSLWNLWCHVEKKIFVDKYYLV